MDRKSCILDAARRLLGQYGAQKTTVADIARAAGVGVGTVYLEFDSKEAIVAELSTRRHRDVLEAMTAAAAAAGPRAAARLRAALMARARGFSCKREEGAHARDLVLCASSAVQAAHRWFKEEVRRFVAGLLAEGARGGELEVGEPLHVAELVLRAHVTFAPPFVFGQSAEEIETALLELHRLLLCGLLRRSVERAVDRPAPVGASRSREVGPLDRPVPRRR
ncbi:MAG: helix-turn-helix domain-containing protein [Polyangiaceae bacterium]